MPKKRHRPSKDDVLNYDVLREKMKELEQENIQVQKRAVIYCRVSSRKQIKEGNGLSSQENVCRRWCSGLPNPIIVDRVFKEPGISSSDFDRPAFNEAYEYVKRKNKHGLFITHMVVSEHSRIGRPENESELGKTFELESPMKQLGVKIVKANMPGLDDSGEGAIINTILYMMSGMEKKLFAKRTKDGRYDRLRKGHRPFWRPPLGYEREKLSVKEYSDNIDPKKGGIIKKGLELFAEDVIVSQADLWRYRKEKGLRTRSEKSKSLSRTFVEKTMQLHRLFFYAGYIIYPARGIDKPVSGKQEALISLITVHKIIKKLQRIENKGIIPRDILSKMSDEHPLRGAVSCPYCKRKFTSWNTNKYRIKNGVKTKKVYPYYGCANSQSCPKNYAIPKHKLESEFEALLEKLKMSKPFLLVLDGIFEKSFQKYLTSHGAIMEEKKKEIKRLEQKMSQIQQAIISSNSVALQNKLEEDWVILNEEKQLISDQIENSDTPIKEKKSMLLKARLIFEDPLALWHLGVPEMKQMLLSVRFGEDLYYDKTTQLRTAGNGSAMRLFEKLGVIFSSGAKEGNNVEPLTNKLMCNYQIFIEKQGAKINWLYTLLDQNGRLHTDKNNKVSLSLPP